MMKDFNLKITREDVYKYNARHDIMHVFLDNYDDNGAYYADEEHKGLNVLKSEETEEVAGFIVMDYSKHIDDVKRYYPQYFRNLPKLSE